MRFLRVLLQQHWGKFLCIAMIATAGVVLSGNPSLRHRALLTWNAALSWSGLREASVRTDEVFWCPMHPQIKSNKENAVCPICNMALVELEGGVVKAPRYLSLTTQQVQQAGVVTKPVVKRHFYREIDTTGRIDYDERLYAGISSWISGKSRIEKLHVSFTGKKVQKGELLAEVYSPELITAQEEFLIALEAARLRQTRTSARSTPGFDPKSIVGSARQRLLYQGMTAAQIDDLTQRQQIWEHIPIYAPISGTVIERHVQEGQYVSEGDWLFHLADLSSLWVFADIYEDELSLVQIGTPVELSVTNQPGKTFSGTVSFIEPRVKPQTRTAPVRIDVDNHDGKLLPGMFARVELHKEFSARLAVPENSVLWSGQRSVVLVKLGEGTFQPREVELGKKWLYAAEDKHPSSNSLGFADRQVRYHEVVAGLSPGDEVVTSGAFLLNAESQFQSVLAKMLPPKSERATFEQAVGQVVAIRFRELLDTYFKLSAALADDNLEPVSRHIRSLAMAAESLAATARDEDAASLAIDAARFETLAKQLSATSVTGFKDARTRFGRISHELTSLLAEHGGKTLFGKEIYQFECGMARVGYERWLWWSPKVHNPYMGQKMLDCGTQLEVLEP